MRRTILGTQGAALQASKSCNRWRKQYLSYATKKSPWVQHQQAKRKTMQTHPKVALSTWRLTKSGTILVRRRSSLSPSLTLSRQAIAHSSARSNLKLPKIAKSPINFWKVFKHATETCQCPPVIRFRRSMNLWLAQTSHHRFSCDSLESCL